MIRHVVLYRIASLLVLGAGATVLMADSADCPDGYAPITWNASFQSDCPSSVAPASGAVHIATPKGADARDRLASGLRDAGFVVDGVIPSGSDGGGDVCTASGFGMTLGPAASSWVCDSVTFNTKTPQTVTCAPSTSKPLVMRVGTQAIDASAVDPDAAPTDAAVADAASTTDAAAPTAQDDGGSGGAPVAPQPATSCKVTFTRLDP